MLKLLVSDIRPKLGQIFYSSLRYFSMKNTKGLSDVINRGEKIAFSSNYVDMCKINTIMGIQPGDKILTIAASGTHALSKLLADPEEVIAVDISAAQLHMSKLQMAGMKLLSREEFCLLIGINRKHIPSTERVRMYRHIRSALEPDTRSFWDRAINDIENGVIYCGEHDKACFEPVFDFLPNVHDKAMVQKFLALGDDMDEQINFYEEIWNTPEWRFSYEEMWSKSAFHSQLSTKFEDVGIKFGTLFLNQFDRLIRHVPNNKSESLEVLLTGESTGACGLNAYLREGNYEFIKERLHRVKWVEGDILHYMKDFASKKNLKKFDGVNLSTATLYAQKPDTVYDMMKYAAGICNKGANLVYYTPFTEFSILFPKDMIEVGGITYDGQDLSCGVLIPRVATVQF